MTQKRAHLHRVEAGQKQAGQRTASASAERVRGEDLLSALEDAEQLVLALPRLLPAVKSFNLIAYIPTPGVEVRVRHLLQRSIRSVSAQAKRFVAAVRLPELWGTPIAQNAERSVVMEVVRHDDQLELSGRFEVAAYELTPSTIHESKRRLPPGGVIGLCSVVRLRDGSAAHIPMMDFKIRPSAKSLDITISAINAIGCGSGVVLNSGASYHFYGLELLSPEQWISFLGRFLLLAPLTDTRYIAHRLIAGTSVLRISAAERKPIVPKVLAVRPSGGEWMTKTHQRA